MKPAGLQPTDGAFIDGIVSDIAWIKRHLGPGAGGGGDGDHTFSANGLLGDEGILSPHKITVAIGQTKTLVSLSQTGGSDDVAWLYDPAGGSPAYIDSSDLPIILSDGDTLALDLSGNVGQVSGHFTISVT